MRKLATTALVYALLTQAMALHGTLAPWAAWAAWGSALFVTACLTVVEVKQHALQQR